MSNLSLQDTKPKLVDPKILIPFIVVTSMFFLWGVPNDLTNPMVSVFKKIMPELSNFEAALVQLAFYGGYGAMAIPAADRFGRSRYLQLPVVARFRPGLKRC